MLFKCFNCVYLLFILLSYILDYGSRGSSVRPLPYVVPCSLFKKGGKIMFLRFGGDRSKVNMSPSCGATLCASSEPTRMACMEPTCTVCRARGWCVKAYVSTRKRWVVCHGREN